MLRDSKYFENEKHPSSTKTLSTTTSTAGIPKSEAKTVIEDEYEGLQDVKMLIREQAGIVLIRYRYIVVERKRRDFTLQGAKEVRE